jgi:polar amino acid transport system substrate-binding protein
MVIVGTTEGLRRLEYGGAMSTPLSTAIAPSGVLRAVINLGNPVLAQGTPDGPSGVTVAIAEDLAGWLRVPLELVCVDAARKSYAAVVEGRADLCFLANEPAREEGLVFSAPYVTIEGVYVVERGSALRADDVDQPGVRVAVREGSAYDLFLARTLQHAEIVRGDEATDVYEAEGLEVCSGVRQPMTEYAESTGRLVLEPSFMQINQAVALPRATDAAAVAAVAERIELLKATGFVAAALRRSGVEATVAPLAR